jgi:hypothetical protein
MAERRRAARIGRVSGFMDMVAVGLCGTGPSGNHRLSGGLQS